MCNTLEFCKSVFYDKKKRFAELSSLSDVESGPRLEVCAVGQLQLHKLWSKSHQRQVEVLHGGNPVDGEMGDLPEARQREECVRPGHAEVHPSHVGAKLLKHLQRLVSWSSFFSSPHSNSNPTKIYSKPKLNQTSIDSGLHWEGPRPL